MKKYEDVWRSCCEVYDEAFEILSDYMGDLRADLSEEEVELEQCLARARELSDELRSK